MSSFFIAPIVEGHGEVQAAPILLQRIFHERVPNSMLRVNPPLRVRAAKFQQDAAYFASYIELAARKAKANENGSVLILLDCEDGCPAEVGCELAEKARALRPDVPFIVGLAYREYETWFLAAAASLRGLGGLPENLQAPANPESIRDAKGWLGRQMLRGYNEPNDQPDFTAKFSLAEARTVPSFERLERKLAAFFATGR